jgi:alkaline phosphatase D
MNDVGAEHPAKEASRDVLLDFYAEPEDSPRRSQEGGIYTEIRFDDPAGSVQVLLLDTRWDRSPLRAAPNEAERRGQGPYLPDDRPGAHILGEAQWVWLAAQLAEAADVRIVVSSIPVLPEFTGWETWANFPAERARLLDLVAGAGPALLVTGDTHWHEISTLDRNGMPLWELGTSGMTHRWKHPADNVHRYAGRVVSERGFGLVRFDWEQREVALEVRGLDGRALISKVIGMDGTDRLPEPMPAE